MFVKARTHGIRRKLSALTLLFTLAIPLTAFGAEAEGYLKTRQAELTTLIKQAKGKASEQKIEGVFDEMLDYDSLARESLAEFWNERSEAEKKEFQGILKQLVQRAYRKNLDKTLNYNVEYRGESKAKDGILVRTVAKHRTNPREEPISVDYVLHKVNGKWRIYDIVTEGSSLVNNYKSQFRRVIKKKGFDELIRKMKTKLEKDEA